MKKTFIPILIIAAVTAVAVLAQPSTSSPAPTEADYEYLSIRYDGDFKTQVFLPDGTVEKLHQMIGVKRPAKVDERMWDFNMAMNFFAKRGYEPLPGISSSQLDLSFRRKRKS
jgi:hypothetical protein